MKARTAKQTRHVKHAHHLKGLLHCGGCGSRMLLDFATNPQGTTYAYFVCSGRAAKRTGCTRRAVPVHLAERLVEDAYAFITISEDTYQAVAAKISEAFDKRTADRDQEIKDLQVNRVRLEAESDKLLAAQFADAIDLATLKRHQDRIRTGLADIERRLAEHDKHSSSARAFLQDSLRLLTDAQRMYAASDDGNRRLANQAFYTRLEITEDEQLRPQLAEPFASITKEGGKTTREQATSAEVACSRNEHWVDSGGTNPNTRRRLERLVSAWEQAKPDEMEGPAMSPNSEPDVISHPGRRNRTPLTEKEVESIRTARDRGESVLSIANRYGIHRGTVWQHTRHQKERRQ